MLPRHLLWFYSILLFALNCCQITLAFSGGHWALLASGHSAAGINDRHQQQQHNNHRHQHGHKCLDIPNNFTLCHGMQYNSMRLPNLLEHDSLDEAIQQSSAWVSLLRLHCHQHTKLFLCSLFAPICLPQLDKPIQPCQSLCHAVQQDCASRMEKYGFPWPAMLNCSQFPEDNELCMKPPSQEEAKQSLEKQSRPMCKSCSQVATFENLMDNFCRSSIVLKVRMRSVNVSHMAIVRKSRVFKLAAASTAAAGDLSSNSAEFPIQDQKQQQRRKFGAELRPKKAISNHRKQQQMELLKLAEHGEGRCQCAFDGPAEGTFLVMASERRKNSGGGLAAKLVVPWRQEKAFKAAIRRFKKVNCSTLGREIRESVLNQMFSSRRRGATGLGGDNGSNDKGNPDLGFSNF